MKWSLLMSLSRETNGFRIFKCYLVVFILCPCMCVCARVSVSVCFFCIVMNMYLVCPIYKILYCLCLAHYQTNIQRLNSLYLQAWPPVSLKFWNLWTTESIQQRETTTISHQSSKTVQDKAIFNIVCLCGLTILRERLEETV